MSYTALARRYRSRAFDEVVGQEPIARTLKNAIETGRVAHAYLFCGTRGVGKTSMARIFAAAINTPDDGKLSDEVFQAVMSGRDQDVIEIDAASNRGVDDARTLIANSIYRPMRGPYKVYIIDEVHMLTREAFNALLKTMEEPPEYVKFILCTTEAHKVPPTIQSRCQRFDFRDIPTARVKAHLADVVKAEKVKADDELLHAVARLGNGSMRDALSLLDRLLASGEKRLTMGVLEELLGLPDRELLGRLIDALAEGDARAALESADALLAKGSGLEVVLDSLASRLRDLMVLCACGADTDLVDSTGDSRDEDAARAERFDIAALSHMIAVCESVTRSLRNSALPRALFDAAMVRLAMTEKLANLTEIVTRLSPTAAPRAGDAPKKA
ncbi:MAG TPA: DNA polymerase III subunit gamma/tau [Phycisphaerales bacterium]|nr:DNA polymerase III subunit gamma/tau [Phycisphaerales bacterium]